MKRALVLALVGPLAGCAGHYGTTNRADAFTGNPDHEVRVEDVPVRGFEIEIGTYQSRDVSGELIAVDARDVFVLEGTRLTIVPRSSVRVVAIELYPSGSGGAALWTVGGTLSTVSHGFFLLLTAPIWIATGTGQAISAARSNDRVMGPGGLDRLRSFARFPQGIPPGFRPGQRAPTALARDEPPVPPDLLR